MRYDKRAAPARLPQKSSLPMSFPFAKPASMTSPNGGHRRLGDYTTDLRRVLVIATISVIVATAGVIGGVVLLQLIGRYRRVLLPMFQLHLTETGAGGNRCLSNVIATEVLGAYSSAPR